VRSLALGVCPALLLAAATACEEPAESSSCGALYVIVSDEDSHQVGGCAASLGRTTDVRLRLHVGDTFTVTTADRTAFFPAETPIPRSEDASVVALAHPGTRKASYRVTGIGRTRLVASTIFCSGSKGPSDPQVCPVAVVTAH
jgi:hypothetical protein